MLIINAMIAGTLTLGLRWLWASPVFAPHWNRLNYKPHPFDLGNRGKLGWMLAYSYGGAWIYGWIYLNMPQLGILTALVLAVMIWLAFVMPTRALTAQGSELALHRIALNSNYELVALLVNALVFSILVF